MRKKWRCEMKNLKLQWIDKIPPLEERNPELFYYDLRDSTAFFPKNHYNYHNTSLPSGKRGLSSDRSSVEDTGDFTTTFNGTTFQIKLSNYMFFR